MIKKLILPATLIALLSSFAAQAKCDLTDLPCWGPDKKCNIKFRNKTGEASGSDGGTGLKQVSFAKTIRVSARKANLKLAGKNALQILAGDAKHMNLDKKTNFQYIKIAHAIKAVETKLPIKMGCSDIRTILQGSGVCKVFYGQKDLGRIESLAYHCDGGNVSGWTTE